MKRKSALAAVLLIIAVFAVALFLHNPAGKTAKAEIVKVSSHKFTDEDFTKSVNCLKETFRKDFKGCELLKLEYVGDSENSSIKYDYLKDQYNIDQAIVYNMVFKTGNNSIAYKNNSIEEIHVIVGRKALGEWQYLDGGRP